MRIFRSFIVPLILLTINALGQPALEWQFTNPQVINDGTQFQFDIEVKADAAGSFHRDLQIYLDYNTLGFGSDVVTANTISYSFLPLMENFYGVVNMVDNTSSKVAIITEGLHEGPTDGQPGSATYFNEITASFQGLLRITIDLISNTETAGIAFDEDLMNGGQYYQSIASIDPVKYADPSIYSNDLLGLTLSSFFGQITYGNSSNTPMTGTVVELFDGSLVASTNTDAIGTYEFSGLNDGNYTMVTSSSNVWGGVTVFDALYVNAAAAGYDMETLLGWDELNFLAADIDGDGDVDVFDVLYAKALAAEYDIPIYQVYKFIEHDITITDGIGNKDYKGLCNGDVDGSYTPPTD